VDTLDGTKALRLGAAGTRGLPPLWPPLQPIVAVCSKFNSKHEAPWPSHECGVYALRTRRLAEDRLQGFLNSTNGDKAEAWAIGRVSLWGRVIECERGWRGQYGYPYAITVLSDDESLVPRLARVYAVDVDAGPPPLVEPEDEDEEDDDPKAGLRAATPPAGSLLQRIRALEERASALAVVAPRATPTSSASDKRRWSWLSYTMTEKQRDDRLWPAVWDTSKEQPATTEQIMRHLARADGADDDCDLGDTASIHQDLTRLTYRGKILKLRPADAPAGKLHWSRWPSRTAGFSEVPDVHFEQDLVVLRVLARAEREGDGPVPVRVLHPALGGSISKAHAVQSLIRCDARGWADGSQDGPRMQYALTPHGRGIVAAKLLITEHRHQPTKDEVLTILRAAAEEGQRFLDCAEILERVVPSQHACWKWWRNGHRIGPKLTKLAEQGLVVHGKRRGNLWTWGMVQ
jgi:hypothetical protein